MKRNLLSKVFGWIPVSRRTFAEQNEAVVVVLDGIAANEKQLGHLIKSIIAQVGHIEKDMNIEPIKVGQEQAQQVYEKDKNDSSSHPEFA